MQRMKVSVYGAAFLCCQQKIFPVIMASLTGRWPQHPRHAATCRPDIRVDWGRVFWGPLAYPRHLFVLLGSRVRLNGFLMTLLGTHVALLLNSNGGMVEMVSEVVRLRQQWQLFLDVGDCLGRTYMRMDRTKPVFWHMLSFSLSHKSRETDGRWSVVYQLDFCRRLAISKWCSGRLRRSRVKRSVILAVNKRKT